MRDSGLGCVERLVGNSPFGGSDRHFELREGSLGKDARSDRHWVDR